MEIFESLGVDKPSDILFITDVHQEATAAKGAGNRWLQLLDCSNPLVASTTQDGYLILLVVVVIGLEAVISVRPGNAPLPENHSFKTITSFSEI